MSHYQFDLYLGGDTLKERINQLKEEKLLPLYTATDLSLLKDAEEVLIKNNLNFIEVTYRSGLASEAIKYLADSGKLIVGAGTVRNIQTAKNAIAHGARFIVTPGLCEEVLAFCQNENILCIPGAVTPSEILLSMQYGVRTIKFFPANIYGGLRAIQALKEPFFDINFIPTGGINDQNMCEYLADEAVTAVGGSFIISENDLIKNGKAYSTKKLERIVEKIN
ncbi:bifunctional 4-hydroxy-2-oxoglutarate aldolase/2-dehydro-3-deoxy-phosphogluconate aldolase [Enterococcus avium]|uniref:bifunctional 4-hydroxy-2-oxoglutarate aldolase/2-dehydro-3-deoxy-phosphogluconate aldolase n=1 Tax=Enterococcus avium TaxID=33945 RepID=UPI002891CE97|nr:bifunctional 4-hydroxy-2-oxoglutarate aldolase/2-dehydro-3-deoxy-phosphogluconate aldolase [Enterococcus avium]MDT2485071.1 bifunctional 4-hydroxy-2-oxoglutarate aldolase/2-dehydro-3-deoxy-phosphogluconate aldolase [Enterococcus avium]MDT2511429.1 bifunctional 4-hydroxy-2-oxoglutarate aldolase/2-dehydro-3-deoxy-phosphogluconate aldolase [Enterococcus avium]